MAKRKSSGISDPGTHELEGGAVRLQSAKRSQQLDSISTNVKEMFAKNKINMTDGIVQLSAKDAHTVLGWMETVGIVADELASVGK